MKDRDCESCKKFSRADPHESEGYCGAKRTWVDPQEGEDCKMHEFTLWSANKYKDGTPIMTKPEVDINSSYPESIMKPESNQLDELKEAAVELTLRNSYLTQRTDESEQRIDELSEEYDAVLKTHGDTLEEHLDRICDLEHMHESVLEKLSALSEYVSINESNIEDLDARLEEVERKINSILKLLTHYDITPYAHIESNFCGNCSHISLKDDIAGCDFTGEIVDPDSASCSMFEPPF